MPFRPLELSEAALYALVGFTRQRPSAGTGINAEAVPLIGSEVTPANPVTQADLDEFMRTHRRRHFRLGPGGTLIPVTD